MNVIVIKADRIAADALSLTVQRVLPGAMCTVKASIQQGWATLAAETPDLVVTGLNPALEGDVLSFLGSYTGRPHPPRILAIANNEEARLLALLATMNVHGAFDALSDDPLHLATAIELVAGGARYWSASIWQHIWSYQSDPNGPYKTLTPSELATLSVLGDGCDDVTAAEHLGLRPMTVASIRRNLHRKLGIQHRGDLVRYAAQHGFVRFTSKGVVRPGLGLVPVVARERKGRTRLAESATVA